LTPGVNVWRLDETNPRLKVVDSSGESQAM